MMISSPAVADNHVVFGTTDGLVRSVLAAGGQLAWSFRAQDGVAASPAIDRGRVFVPSFDGHLQALRLADGMPIWRVRLGGIAFSSPVVVDGSVIVAGGAPLRKVFRIDAAAGGILWDSGDVMAEFSNSSAVVAGKQVIVGANGGQYTSFDLATGSVRWRFSTGGAVSLAAPVVGNGWAFILPGGDDNRLYAVDVLSGGIMGGWPVQIAPPALDTTGTILRRRHAVSSPVLVAGALAFGIRFDETLDKNADGRADAYLSREYVMGVDATTGAALWRTPNGRLETTKFGTAPAFEICPTPAAYVASDGGPLVVVASSLAATLRTLDAATGTVQWSTATSGPTRGSPVFANGRLLVGTDAGVMHSFLSWTNTPPPAPTGFAPSAGQSVSHIQPTVRWGAVQDRERDQVSLQIRIDADGEVLENWMAEIAVPAGQTVVRIPLTLTPGQIYTYAVRARDSWGAWSPWSAGQTLKAEATPTVSLRGMAQPGLIAALISARAGDVVMLGAGTYHLTETIRMPSGVALVGAGAGRTVLSAVGLGIGIEIDGGTAAQPTEIKQLTIAGAGIGVRISGAKDALVQNVLVRDNSDAGVDVGASASVRLWSDTLVRNGTAVRAYGTAAIRNSMVMNNERGLWASPGTVVTSRYNNVTKNRLADYQDVVAGQGDLAVEVMFDSAIANDFHLMPAQGTTDRGDPADDFALEPQPNGGRINIGAFGNTREAELSAQDPSAADAGAVEPNAVEPNVVEPNVVEPGASPVDGGGPDGDPAGSVPNKNAGCACTLKGRASDPLSEALWLMSCSVLLLRWRRRR